MTAIALVWCMRKLHGLGHWNYYVYTLKSNSYISKLWCSSFSKFLIYFSCLDWYDLELMRWRACGILYTGFVGPIIASNIGQTSFEIGPSSQRWYVCLSLFRYDNQMLMGILHAASYRFGSSVESLNET